MAATIYSVEYYTTTVQDKPGQGCRFLKLLAEEQVNLLAFNAFPAGRERMQLIIYPLNATWLGDVARRRGVRLLGPRHAFMIHGDDELGALTGIHQLMCDAKINIAGSSGVTDGRGRFRYIMHVADRDFGRACEVLKVDQTRTVPHELRLRRRRRLAAV